MLAALSMHSLLTLKIPGPRMLPLHARFAKLDRHIERAKQISDCRFRIGLRLLQDAHSQRRIPNIIDSPETGAMLQVRAERNPRRPPCHVPIPDPDLFLIQVGAE